MWRFVFLSGACSCNRKLAIALAYRGVGAKTPGAIPEGGFGPPASRSWAAHAGHPSGKDPRQRPRCRNLRSLLGILRSNSTAPAGACSELTRPTVTPAISDHAGPSSPVGRGCPVLFVSQFRRVLQSPRGALSLSLSPFTRRDRYGRWDIVPREEWLRKRWPHEEQEWSGGTLVTMAHSRDND